MLIGAANFVGSHEFLRELNVTFMLLIKLCVYEPLSSL